jgi:hypothetical protein
MTSSRVIRFAALAFLSALLMPALVAGQPVESRRVASADQPLRPDPPVFRDPKTGTLWSPDTVNQDDRPEPSERGPDGQPVFPGPPIELKPRIHLIGNVPVTAGPSVPLIEIDNPSIQTAPEDHWHVVFYLQNNSDSTLAAEVACTFGNEGRTVARAVVFVPTVKAGTRVAVYFAEPTTTLFLDAMTCQVSPP